MLAPSTVFPPFPRELLLCKDTSEVYGSPIMVLALRHKRDRHLSELPVVIAGRPWAAKHQNIPLPETFKGESNPTFTKAPSIPPTTTLQPPVAHNSISVNDLQPPQPPPNSHHTYHGPSQQAQCHLAQRRWPAAFRPRREGSCLRIPAYRRFRRGPTLRRLRAQLEEQREGEPVRERRRRLGW